MARGRPDRRGVRAVPRRCSSRSSSRESCARCSCSTTHGSRSRRRRRPSSHVHPSGSRHSCRSSSSGTARGWPRTSAPTRSRSSSSTGSRTSPSTALSPPPRTSRPGSPPQRIRSPTSASTAATRRRGTSAVLAAPPIASTGCTRRPSSRSGSPRPQRLAEQATEVYALFNNNRDDFAPRSAAIFRGLLDEAGIQATGGVEPPSSELRLF